MDLTLAEQVLLLAVDDQRGRDTAQWGSDAGLAGALLLGLAGALLLDLARLELLIADADGKLTTAEAEQPQDQLLREAYAAIGDRDESGKVKLHQVHEPAAQGPASGALWGGLIGLLFLTPLLGTALGAAAGGASGAMVDVGVNDDFVRTPGQKLTNGGAALILLARKITPDKVLPRISQFGGEVIQTSLGDESEARLREVLELREAVAQPVA